MGKLNTFIVFGYYDMKIHNYRKITGEGMKTRLILKPGQKGTKKLTDKYGDALVCVRYRYDADSRQRLKTVELIVDRTDWTPPATKYSADTLVPVHIEGYEIELRAKAKAAGGRWNPEKQVWFVQYGKIAGTQLEKLIQPDKKDNSEKPKKRLYVYTS